MTNTQSNQPQFNDLYSYSAYPYIVTIGVVLAINLLLLALKV